MRQIDGFNVKITDLKLRVSHFIENDLRFGSDITGFFEDVCETRTEFFNMSGVNPTLHRFLVKEIEGTQVVEPVTVVGMDMSVECVFKMLNILSEYLRTKVRSRVDD